MLKEPMPLINLTFAHGQTLEEARRRLEKAVHEVSSQFGGVRWVEWAADRNRVKLEGAGVRVEMWVDAQNVHATGDIPILGNLFRSRQINRSNSELVVLVTPRIVDPVKLNNPPSVPPANPIQFMDNPKFDHGMPASSPHPESNTGNIGQPTPSSK